jgi:hypothetical protein
MAAIGCQTEEIADWLSLGNLRFHEARSSVRKWRVDRSREVDDSGFGVAFVKGHLFPG